MQLKMSHLLLWCFHDFMMSTAFVTVTPRLSDIWTAVGNFDAEGEDIHLLDELLCVGCILLVRLFSSF